MLTGDCSVHEQGINVPVGFQRALDEAEEHQSLNHKLRCKSPKLSDESLADV
jgi:hypothetical protein